MTAMVQDFNVTWDDDYAVHAGLELMIQPAGTNIATKRNHKPASLSDAVKRAIDMHVEYNATDHNQERKQHDARKHITQRIHTSMDKLIDQHIQQLHDAAEQCDTTTLWRTIAKCIERAIGHATGCDERQMKLMAGHGRPNI